MSESEFSKAAGIALASIERSIDELELDCECTFKGDGILQIEFDDGAKFILNRHLAAREFGLPPRRGEFILNLITVAGLERVINEHWVNGWASY